MIKERPKKAIVFENWFLRLFSAWCLSAVFFYVTDGGTLAMDGAAEVRLLIFLPIFALNVAAVTLIKALLGRTRERADAVVLAVCFSLYALMTVLRAESWYYSLGLAAVAALFAWYCRTKGYLRVRRPVTSVGKWGVAAVMFCVFVLIVGGTSVLRYRTYGAPNYDFGIFCHMFYYMKKSFLPFTTCERDMLLSHFAVHISPIFYVLLPLYCLFPSPVTLELAQPLILGSAVLPVMLLAKRCGLSNARTLAVCAIVLFHPAVISGTNYDLHENCFLLPLLLWVFYFFETERPAGLAIFTALTLTVKEDAAVYIVFFALYALLGRRRPVTAAAMALGALAYFLAALFLLTKYGVGVMSGRYENYLPLGGSLADVVKNVLVNPGYVFTQLFVDKEGGYAAKLLFILQMFAPFAFMPFAVKKVSQLLLVLPMVLINLMPVYPYQYDIGFQYHFGVLAFLVYLSVLNLSAMPRATAKTFLCVGTAVTLVLFSAVLPRVSYYVAKYRNGREDYAVMDEALARIPADAKVVCSTYLLPHLLERDEIYEDWYHQTGPDEDADYVILDMRAAYEEYREKYEALGYTDVSVVSGQDGPLLCVMTRP